LVHCSLTHPSLREKRREQRGEKREEREEREKREERREREEIYSPTSVIKGLLLVFGERMVW